MSQPSVITLAITDPVSGLPVDQVYNRINPIGDNATLYRQVGSDLRTRREIRLEGTLPKRNGNFAGVTRTSVKIVRTAEVPLLSDTLASPDTTEAPITVNIQFNPPSGVAEAEMLYGIREARALLEVYEANLLTLNTICEV